MQTCTALTLYKNVGFFLALNYTCGDLIYYPGRYLPLFFLLLAFRPPAIPLGISARSTSNTVASVVVYSTPLAPLPPPPALLHNMRAPAYYAHFQNSHLNSLSMSSYFTHKWSPDVYYSLMRPCRSRCLITNYVIRTPTVYKRP